MKNETEQTRLIMNSDCIGDDMEMQYPTEEDMEAMTEIQYPTEEEMEAMYEDFIRRHPEYA